ncbi:MAG: 3'(2'),5'-bisphosphate nucleotidase CysQ [Alphaproteobacteria bacterium]|nr:3'(2'),5'-bisphosphate nucleotidase CysQ [Alphaproteobacteria bacterium]
MQDPDLQERIEAARLAVREAGAIAMRYFEEGVKTWHKTDDEPVSEADYAVDDHLKEKLVGRWETDGWLSEESSRIGAEGARKLTWVVDPIDGTRAFIKQKPHFTVCLGLVENDRAVYGAVYNPALDEFFEAEAGEGALCNGRPIHVNSHDRLDGLKMIGYREMFAEKHWKSPWPKIEVALVNSIAYRMVLVASGAHDAVVNLRPQNDWDIVAAELILREAGGKCTDRDGNPYRFHGQGGKNQSVIAANPVLQDKLVEKFRDFAPKIPKSQQKS